MSVVAVLSAVIALLQVALSVVDIYQFLQTCYDYKDDYNNAVKYYNQLV